MTEVEEKREKKIRRGLVLEEMCNTAGWKEVLEPWITGRIEKLKDDLVEREGDKADQTRGSIKAYKAIAEHIGGLITIKRMAMKVEKEEEKT